MSLALKKINKLSQLVPNRTYLLFNKDIESSMSEGSNNSYVNIKILDVEPMLAVGKVDLDEKILIRQDMLNKYLYIYDLDSKSENTDTTNTVELKRRIRKLEKKNAKLNGVLSKHNIDLNEHKNFAAKKNNNNKTMRITNTYRENLFGYDVFVVIKTNKIDKVEVMISLIKDRMVVKGIAIKHKDDIFNYKLGKQLAYARAITAFLERIM